nr:MAG TPA: hypothetical protein [Caudoviricetes sp.]
MGKQIENYTERRPRWAARRPDGHHTNRHGRSTAPPRRAHGTV